LKEAQAGKELPEIDFIDHQKKLCKIYGVDFRKVEEINSMLKPLLQNLDKNDVNKVSYTTILNIRRNVDSWLELWKFSTSKSNLTPKQKSLLELYLYLVLSEGVFSETIQAVAFLLVANHHDIYDVEKREFVKDYEGLNNVSLFYKLQFVERHGFVFISSSFDRDLRNLIAHLRIEVQEDGKMVEITRQGKTGKKVESIEKKTDYLGCICALTLLAIEGSLGTELKRRGLKLRLS